MNLKRKIVAGLIVLSVLFVTRVHFLVPDLSLSKPQKVQKGYYDYQGVIHFHTSYSGDATGTFEEIAKVANRQNVDFMISTDHDTLQPLDDQKEGWYQNTLFLTGEELNVKEGYLLALDIQRHINVSGQEIEKVFENGAAQGGIFFLAHPNHPQWQWKSDREEGCSGQEVLDFADQWYTVEPMARLTGLIYYPINPGAGLLQLYHDPVETLKGWDSRISKKNFVGIFAPDFHQSVKILKGFKIPFPAVDKILPLAHDHILLHSPWTGNLKQDKRDLYAAIRHGHLFFSMDILGNATGFLFSARQEDQVVWMGDQLPAGVKTFFSVELPESAASRKTRIRVIHDGKPIFVTEDKAFHFQSASTGAYRIEVETLMPTFWGNEKSVVWIYSNPIYLRQ
ncbi:MAG: PHP domain-containing protein [Nitrospirae bacterium]|nr:PHP domain-containing protein [Nitrospirota bacterium]